MNNKVLRTIFSLLPLIIVLIIVIVFIVYPRIGNDAFGKLIESSFFTFIGWCVLWVLFLFYLKRKQKVSLAPHIIAGLIGAVIFLWVLIMCAAGMGLSKL